MDAFLSFGSSCIQVGSKCTGICLFFGLNEQGQEVDTGVWATQYLHIHCPGFCALERSLQIHFIFQTRFMLSELMSHLVQFYYLARQTAANNKGAYLPSLLRVMLPQATERERECFCGHYISVLRCSMCSLNPLLLIQP